MNEWVLIMWMSLSVSLADGSLVKEELKSEMRHFDSEEACNQFGEGWKRGKFMSESVRAARHSAKITDMNFETWCDREDTES